MVADFHVSKPRWLPRDPHFSKGIAAEKIFKISLLRLWIQVADINSWVRHIVCGVFAVGPAGMVVIKRPGGP